MEQLQTLLAGALEARGRVLAEAQRRATATSTRVIALLPSMKSPTVVEAVRRRRLRGRDRGRRRTTINTLIPALKDAGATDIIELPISKIVH